MPNLLENEDLIKCSECGTELEHDDIIEHNGDIYCEGCESELFIYCEDCGNMVDTREDNYHSTDTGCYCDDCISEHYTECNDCSTLVDNNDILYAECDNEHYCQDCYYERFSCCDDCGEDYYRDDILYHEGNECYYCEHCYNEHSHDDMDYFNSKDIDLSDNTFNHIPSKIKFGIELEVDDSDIDTNLIEQNTHFGCTDDGSLSQGYEFVSPILQGDKGYNDIKELCKVIKGKNVSSSTGYHLHLDGRDLKAVDIRKIWKMYYFIEDIIFRMLPDTRYRNNYCKRVSVNTDSINDCITIDKIREHWYRGDYSSSKYHHSRYHGLNLHAYFYQSTIEIRYHTGTTNFNKIVQWIKLHQSIMEYAINHKESSIDMIGKMLEDTDISSLTIDRAKIILKMIGLDDTFIEYYEGRFNRFKEGYTR